MHAIRFISDEHMPEGHDWLYVDIPNGALVFIRDSALLERNFEEAWDAYRAAKTYPPMEPTEAPVSQVEDLLTEAEVRWLFVA